MINEISAKQGKKIEKLRGDMTREEYVNCLDNILTSQSLYRVEKGTRKASDKVLKKIADKHELPLSYFYEEEGEYTVKNNQDIKLEDNYIEVAKYAQDKKVDTEKLKSIIDLLSKD